MRLALDLSGFFARWTHRMQTEVTQFGLDPTTTSWIVGLAIFFVLMGVWSSFGRLRAGGSMTLKAKNVFLTVKLWTLGEQDSKAQGHQAHILALDPRHVTFVSSRYIGKGEKIRLGLESLPGYPEDGLPVEAEVQRARPMRGEADSFVITARFGEMSPQKKVPLVRYLEQLTRPGKLAQA